MSNKEPYGLVKVSSGVRIQKLGKFDVMGNPTNQLADIGSTTKTKECSSCTTT